MLSDRCSDFGSMAKRARNKPLARLEAMQYLQEGCEHYGDPSYPVSYAPAIVEMLKGACQHYSSYPCESNWEALITTAEAVRIHLDRFPGAPVTDEHLEAFVNGSAPSNEILQREAREALETRRAWRAAS